MRRRPRIDLGQSAPGKVEVKLDRKRARWAERNKDSRPEDNPFLKAIKPDQEVYGELEEKGEELRARLSNLEFGNFPGYFNYRNKAAAPTSKKLNNDQDHDIKDEESTKDSGDSSSIPADCDINQSQSKNPLEAGSTDERLKYLKQEWFHKKNVLDIGCNRGHITYAVAHQFSPTSIVGIDIDLKMVNMANKDLHLYLENVIVKRARENRLQHAINLRSEVAAGCESFTAIQEDNFPLSSYIARGPLALADFPVVGTESSFPNNIVFMEHNYVLATDELVAKQEPKFDTILCLSVTKWIHLNYRDDGMKRFFKRIYNHLKPNGLLVLEAQPFDNYGRRRKLSDRLKSNYYTIQFKPEEFDGYLLSKQVGFREIIYESVTNHQCAGFKRPLKVFLK